MQHNVEAQHELAYCYVNARGVPRNYQQAIKLYTAAAMSGYRASQLELAHIYERGEITDRNADEAARWREKANQGVAIDVPDDAHPILENYGQQMK